MDGCKIVEVWLYQSSEPQVFEAKNTYTKGPMFCVYTKDDKVYKFPVQHIFRVIEDYRHSETKVAGSLTGKK